MPASLARTGRIRWKWISTDSTKRWQSIPLDLWPVSQAFLPHLLKDRPGTILTISNQMSWMGYRKADRIAYRASKAAVNKVMQGLATELETDGVPVALIDPGWVRTAMGGPDADHCPADVANGILTIAETMDLSGTGKFFKWTGEEREF